MTVARANNRWTFPGGTGAVSFAITEVVYDVAHLTVAVVNDTTRARTTYNYGADYAVTGVGSRNGVTITLTATVPSGSTLVVDIRPPATQTLSLTNAGAFNPQDIERRFDEFTYWRHAVNEELGRCVKFAEGESASGSLAGISTRASKYLGFNASGAFDYLAASSAGAGTYLEKPTSRTALSTDKVLVQTSGGAGGVTTYYVPIAEVANVDLPTVTQPTSATLSTGSSGSVIATTGMFANITYTLPAGADGLWYVLHNDSDTYTLTIDPNGSQVIGSGAAGEATTLRTRGWMVVQWVNGRWEVTEVSGVEDFYVRNLSRRLLASRLGAKSVADYGAVGDGVADDTAAIQAALDAKGVIFFPNGRYRTTSPLIVRHDTRIVGSTRAGDSPGSIIVPVYSGSQYPIQIDGANGSGGWVYNLEIEDIYFDASYWTGSATHFLNITAVYSTTLRRVTVDGAPAAKKCIRVAKSNHLVLDTVRTFRGGGTDNAVGIDVVDADGEINGLILLNCDPEWCDTGVSFSGTSASITADMIGHYSERCDTFIDWNAGHSESKLTIVGGHLEGRASATGVKIQRSNCTVSGLAMVNAGDFGVDVVTTHSPANCHVIGGHLSVSTPVRDTNVLLATNTYRAASTTYTCTWTATSGTPAVGSGGQKVASYTLQGKLCTATIRIDFGTTPTLGTGTWTFSLPFAANSIANNQWVGTAMALESGTGYKVGACRLGATGTTVEVFFDGATGAAGPTVPFTWGSDETLNLTITYPVA